ncbi:MAG TPA: hypothetical protein VMB85_21580 [Bryobacteraceae bacterium]|nr:hypothetical protein [Bryobacteraceae bacterium]
MIFKLLKRSTSLQRERFRVARLAAFSLKWACLVSFAGLISPGLFQFNVTVPSSLAGGDQPITATYGGLTTQAGTLVTVQ